MKRKHYCLVSMLVVAGLTIWSTPAGTGVDDTDLIIAFSGDLHGYLDKCG